MSTLADMISRVRSAFKLVDADNIITNRVCADELIAARNKLVKQQVDKRRLFSTDNIFTNIPCLQMQQVPLASCCDYTSPCMISRSILQLPSVGISIYGPLIDGVYSIDGSVKFNYMDPDRYANILRLYPNGKTPDVCWIKDNYLYVSDSMIEEVSPRIFFDKLVTPSMYSCKEPPCCPENPMDMDFKCPGYLEEDVVNIAREMILRDYKRSEDDKTVDQNDTSK